MTDRRRRPHPAHKARIVTAGVAAATVLGITAAMGFAQDPAAPPAGSDTPAVADPAPGGDATRSSGGASTGVRPATPAPFDRTTTTRPDATTHGSR